MLWLIWKKKIQLCRIYYNKETIEESYEICHEHLSFLNHSERGAAHQSKLLLFQYCYSERELWTWFPGCSLLLMQSLDQTKPLFWYFLEQRDQPKLSMVLQWNSRIACPLVYRSWYGNISLWSVPRCGMSSSDWWNIWGPVMEHSAVLDISGHIVAEQGKALNGHIIAEQGKALNAVAPPNVKVLVVENSCNTKCWNKI